VIIENLIPAKPQPHSVCGRNTGGDAPEKAGKKKIDKGEK